MDEVYYLLTIIIKKSFVFCLLPFVISLSLQQTFPYEKNRTFITGEES